MKFAGWRSSSVSRACARGAGSCALAAMLLAVAIPAPAATFYKWTDKDGTVHYGDTPPKGFTGTVTPVEVDPGTHTMPSPAPAKAPEKAAAPEPGAQKAPPAPDLLTQRRETRARLEANLAHARERLDLAQKALAEFTDTGGGDEQYTQRQVDPSAVNPNPFPSESRELQKAPIANPDLTQSVPATGGMLGMAPRSTCRQVVNPEGKKMLVCPTAVPNQDYYRRLQELEDAVKRAQAGVEEAERAYRRGVD